MKSKKLGLLSICRRTFRQNPIVTLAQPQISTISRTPTKAPFVVSGPRFSEAGRSSRSKPGPNYRMSNTLPCMRLPLRSTVPPLEWFHRVPLKILSLLLVVLRLNKSNWKLYGEASISFSPLLRPSKSY
jgi:hypothetical protein